MKAIAFVLAVFIGFLVVQPCADLDVHLQDHKSMQLESTHSHHSDAQDYCSAFCICACCGTLLQQAIPFFYKQLIVAVKYIQHSYGYFTGYQSKFLATSWEPPIL